MSWTVLPKVAASAITAGGIVGGGSYVIHDLYPNSLWSCKFEQRFKDSLKLKDFYKDMFTKDSGSFKALESAASTQVSSGVPGAVSP
ncbi:hypothetical protein MHLP_01530 [Candidatus Mycoplasma haematolamae str. Purdue]|uniref:Uncharacterized protein n=1 Tax=Mycoplasma haematolamae (strain Purdue) TaxID=1212765 RepID=I7CF56_MYCHA|nr:hypothetical protein [Candidatus Mycoplasma haematolamae]AFO51886.1 hypothetical protein MHLP_01530 [Candidatus Mycoplasma haematolamae str. Purdue]